jgi:hypothetical protein
MLQLLFIIIILFIIINQIIECTKPAKKSSVETVQSTSNSDSDSAKPAIAIQTPSVAMQKPSYLKSPELFKNMNRMQEIDKPNPWTKIEFDDKSEYKYLYYIKIPIPTLNDLQAWQQLLPNLDFDPKSGELIIPSKDEASALAVANLMVNNFSGELTLDNILENNLIQISIEKAIKFDVVRNKLREQIVNNLYGAKTIKSNDLSNNLDEDLTNIINKKDNVNKLESFDAYEGGSDFSYI